ncbi:DegV family protein [Cellulomonas sp. PhB143]|uniref:DegV family protein n=1 Tax=Cellulomonas sp. PhB143 TaxID=2485186 RepID=UPI000F460C99|nr:DegV family protein [Cellulomonas sp. PhB143]ROS73644.1 DegV family protein with EDD domain [Cellulomonas sp. PhB143]
MAVLAVVTDSTASLPDGFAQAFDHAPLGAATLQVVPLHVLVGDVSYLEGVDVGDEDLAAFLRAGADVSTSQPTSEALLEAYRRAAAAGAEKIVSVHLSGSLSGTVQAAARAAALSPVPVRVVDSRTVAMALGFAALAGAQAAASGQGADAVERRVRDVAASTRAVFMVGSLDRLRRGGRLSAPAAAIGGVLGVRPLLSVRDGEIVVVQKVRTRRAAVDRLLSVALDSAGRRTAPRFAVHHLGDVETAEEVAGRLASAVGAPVEIAAVSAVVGAHVGEGVLAIIVADDAPRPAPA